MNIPSKKSKPAIQKMRVVTVDKPQQKKPEVSTKQALAKAMQSLPADDVSSRVPTHKLVEITDRLHQLNIDIAVQSSALRETGLGSESRSLLNIAVRMASDIEHMLLLLGQERTRIIDDVLEYADVSITDTYLEEEDTAPVPRKRSDEDSEDEEDIDDEDEDEDEDDDLDDLPPRKAVVQRSVPNSIVARSLEEDEEEETDDDGDCMLCGLTLAECECESGDDIPAMPQKKRGTPQSTGRGNIPSLVHVDAAGFQPHAKPGDQDEDLDDDQDEDEDETTGDA